MVVTMSHDNAEVTMSTCAVKRDSNPRRAIAFAAEDPQSSMSLFARRGYQLRSIPQASLSANDDLRKLSAPYRPHRAPKGYRAGSPFDMFEKEDSFHQTAPRPCSVCSNVTGGPGII